MKRYLSRPVRLDMVAGRRVSIARCWHVFASLAIVFALLAVDTASAQSVGPNAEVTVGGRQRSCADIVKAEPSGRAVIRVGDAPAYVSDTAQAKDQPWSFEALDAVLCHAGGRTDGSGERGRILVSSMADGRCAWVDPSILVQQSQLRPSALGQQTNLICQKPVPLKAGDVAERRGGASLDAKLLIWNVNSDPTSIDPAGPSDTADDIKAEVPLYAQAGGDTIGKIRVYNIFPVFDVQNDGEEDYYLIGEQGDQTRLLGWVNSKSGVIWDNRLSLFFKPGQGTSYIFASKTAAVEYDQGADPAYVAKTPDNIEDTFNLDFSVARFPILSKPRPGLDPEIYDIAYIGSPNCLGGAEGCVNRVDVSRARQDLGDKLDRANDIDIVFLIDATESMEPYFAAVTRAVSDQITQFSGNHRVQIGVALYGDYENPGQTKPGDPVQFRWARSLQALLNIDELDSLLQEDTFADPQRDRPEAVIEGLRRVAESPQWRQGTQKRLIHIGDHGDRITQAPPDLVQTLIDNEIFYFPVAVTGRYDAPHNANLRKLMAGLGGLLRTPKGEYRGLPLQVAYDIRRPRAHEDVDAAAETLAISLNGVMNAASDIVEQVITEIYGTAGTVDVPQQSERPLPPGYASMTAAMREVMNVTPEKLEHLLRQGEIVAQGYALKHDPGGQDQWDYFVGMEPEIFKVIQTSMGLLCSAATRSYGPETLLQTLKAQLKALSGDSIKPDQSIEDYFRKSLAIPLAENTVLSRPYDEMVRMLENPNTPADEIIGFRQEICRSSTLLGLAENNQKLADIENGLMWQRDRWIIKGQLLPFRWLVRYEVGLPLYYIPLEYFPGTG